MLLDWNYNIKIVDFGLSNTYKKEQLLKTACGSPCYAAPEMIANKKYSGLNVDIWSCGVILFAMVCGYLPFEDSNTSNLYKKILSGSYVLPPFISSDLKDLLGCILCVDPEKRYDISKILSHPWCRLSGQYKVPQGLIVGFHRMPIDNAILQKLKQYNFDLDYSSKCIDANKHNHITTTYYLLLKKLLKGGGKSSADISSPSFDYEQVKPLKRQNNSRQKHRSIDKQAMYCADYSLRPQHVKRQPSRSNEKSLLNIRESDIDLSRNKISMPSSKGHNSNKVDSRSGPLKQKREPDLKMYLRSHHRKEFVSETRRKYDVYNRADYGRLHQSTNHNNSHLNDSLVDGTARNYADRSYLVRQTHGSLSKDTKISNYTRHRYLRKNHQNDEIKVSMAKERGSMGNNGHIRVSRNQKMPQ